MRFNRILVAVVNVTEINLNGFIGFILKKVGMHKILWLIEIDQNA